LLLCKALRLLCYG
nr:immunoglobulin heavy chain junction region [Mus musculus]